MGKAKIISGGDKGLYNIELVEHTARITSDLAKIDARLSLLATAISDALAAKAIAQADYNAKRSALDTVIGQYIVGQAKKSDVDAAQSAYLAAMKTLQAKSSSHSLLQQEQESKTKQKALLEAIPLAHTVDGVWCADLTEDLAAGVEVGTIEPNGEPDGDIIIYPGGTADPLHQQLQPVMSSTPAGWFLNMARFPGWQRWKPTFRIGTITALYSAEDYCDVTLDSALSSVQNLNITPSPTLTRVPVEYLTCNCTAFSVGDRVVVQFTGQDWSTPKVIGFESNPKGCGAYAIFAVNSLGQGLIEIVIIWDIQKNELVMGPVEATSAEYIDWLEEHDESGSEMISDFAYDSTQPYKIDPDLIDPAPIGGPLSTYGWSLKYHALVEHYSGGIYWYDLFPESAYGVSALTQPEYAGIRTEHEYESTRVYDENGEDYTYSATNDYHIYGPFGLMGEFSGWENGSYTYALRTMSRYFIPGWTATNDGGYDPEEAHAYGHYWYNSSLKGSFDDNYFAVCCLVVYVPCTETSSRAMPNDPAYTWVFGNRVVLVQAQASQIPGENEWTASGNNNALSSKIVEAMDTYFSVNNIPVAELRGAKIEVKIYE